MLNDYILDKTMRQNVRDLRQQAEQDDQVRRAVLEAQATRPATRPALLGRLGISVKIVVRRVSA